MPCGFVGRVWKNGVANFGSIPPIFRRNYLSSGCSFLVGQLYIRHTGHPFSPQGFRATSRSSSSSSDRSPWVSPKMMGYPVSNDNTPKENGMITGKFGDIPHDVLIYLFGNPPAESTPCFEAHAGLIWVQRTQDDLDRRLGNPVVPDTQSSPSTVKRH